MIAIGIISRVGNIRNINITLLIFFGMERNIKVRVHSALKEKIHRTTIIFKYQKSPGRLINFHVIDKYSRIAYLKRVHFHFLSHVINYHHVTPGKILDFSPNLTVVHTFCHPANSHEQEEGA